MQLRSWCQASVQVRLAQRAVCAVTQNAQLATKSSRSVAHRAVKPAMTSRLRSSTALLTAAVAEEDAALTVDVSCRLMFSQMPSWCTMAGDLSARNAATACRHC